MIFALCIRDQESAKIRKARKQLERKTAQWLLKEDAASDQAFDKAAHAYLGKLHYKLYKYQGIPDCKAKGEDYLRLKRHLQNHEMSLSSPSTFNDPFDCHMAFPGTSRQDLATRSRDIVNTIWRVGCLTESPCNRLMWSHYADNHRGLCIEYDFSAFDPFTARVTFAPVIYSPNRPQVPEKLLNDVATDQLDRQDYRFLASTLFTKDSVWQYESEWRIVKGVHTCASYTKQSCSSRCGLPYSIPECYLAPSLYYEFEMPPISAVYFGAAIDDSCKGQVAKKELQELCSRAGIPTFSMRLDEVGYAVHPIPE